MNRTFSIKTLGCKNNQYESSVIAASLEAMGFVSVPFGTQSSVVIVNTCTVTDNADKKCRNYIRQGARFSKNGRVIVAGCMAHRMADILRKMDEVLDVIDIGERSSIGKRIAESAGFFEEQKITDQFKENDAVPFGHVRGYLRIQDGCDGECTYCVVPLVRGKPTSRPYNEVLGHAKKIIAEGVREIVLTGITIGQYRDGDNDVASLAESILSLDGDFRLRITSIEPTHVSPRLAALYTHPKLCPHIHLPLQSGSNRILAMMKRPYTAEEYMEKVTLLRSVRPDIAIGTDVIVGFPGESDDDFLQTISVIKAACVSYVHRFSYSRRSGTPAAKETLCDNSTVRLRVELLDKTANVLERSFTDQFIGNRSRVVIEKHGNSLIGVTPHYIRLPIDVDSKLKVGEFADVEIVQREDKLIGKI